MKINEIRLWYNRYHLDGIGYYLLIILMIINNVLDLLILEFDAGILKFGVSSIWLIIYFVATYLTKKIIKEWGVVLKISEDIFMEPNDYQKFTSYLEKQINSKKEFIIGLIIGIIWSLGMIYVDYIANDFQYLIVDGAKFYIPINRLIYYYIDFIVLSIVGITFGPIFFSAFYLVIGSYKAIKQLGSPELKLKITIRHLTIGAFKFIGDFIITISIPVLIGCTILSIGGYIWMLFGASPFVTYSLIIGGILIDTIIVYFLYSNTIQIHIAIVNFKLEIFQKLMDDIQIEMNAQHVDYGKITQIYSFKKEIDSIEEWPFNPTSMKKLFATSMSTVLPLVLSFFGFNY